MGNSTLLNYAPFEAIENEVKCTMDAGAAIIILLIILFLIEKLPWKEIFNYGILIGIVCIAVFITFKIRKALENYANEVREKKTQEEQRRENERRQREYEEENKKQAIENKKFNLEYLLKSSQIMIESMPTLIKEAEKHLDIAEQEFSEGVFAPFWDQIENATNKLAAYQHSLNRLNQNASSYRNEASLLLPIKSPDFKLPDSKLPDARPTVQRLVKIVRTAQKNFHFSTIYEQRKTNRLLYEGFSSLGNAIYSLGNQVSSSLQNLSDQLHVSLSDLIDSSQEQTRVISQEHEDMKHKVEDFMKTAAEEAVARRRFEQDSLRKQDEQNNMLDNIQRGRKPR